MTSFKFPPPPPPPPKATSNDNQQSYASQRGGPSRGSGGNKGGDRGRGAGRGRGRGDHGRSGGSFSQGRGNAHGGRGGLRGGFGNQPGGSNLQQYQPSQQSGHGMCDTQQGGQAQPHLNPQAFAQAMSFMSTPAGMQSMAAFAQHMSSPTNNAPQYPQSPPPTQGQAPRYSPGQQAGQKRKRPEHNTSAPPLPPKKPQSGPKPPRAKAAAPPAVPSFGFSLPAPAAPTSKPSNTRNEKKRVNLGLSEHNAMDESSDEEEDVDEEAALAEKIKVEGVAFEHNGEMISLQTAADVQAYIKDRRRNYPTQQRVHEKMQEAAAKREHELEFLHRVTGKSRKTQAESRPAKPPKPERKPRELDSKKQEDLAALRKKLHESMMNKHRQPTNLLGTGYDSETDSDAESSVLSDSSVLSLSEDSSDVSTSDEEDGESDSDAAPETTSSKTAPPPAVPPRAAPVAAPASQVCKNWSKSGKCKFGKGCRWAHPADDKGTGQQKADREKRMGLYEKLVEQEKEAADRLALEAIKYLGQNGFLG